MRNDIDGTNPFGGYILSCSKQVSCSDREVLLSLVYRLVRCLFGLLAALIRSDLSKDVELLVLRHENQMLRRRLGGRRR